MIIKKNNIEVMSHLNIAKVMNLTEKHIISLIKSHLDTIEKNFSIVFSETIKVSRNNRLYNSKIFYLDKKQCDMLIMFMNNSEEVIKHKVQLMNTFTDFEIKVKSIESELIQREQTILLQNKTISDIPQFALIDKAIEAKKSGLSEEYIVKYLHNNEEPIDFPNKVLNKTLPSSKTQIEQGQKPVYYRPYDVEQLSAEEYKSKNQNAEKPYSIISTQRFNQELKEVGFAVRKLDKWVTTEKGRQFGFVDKVFNNGNIQLCGTSDVISRFLPIALNEKQPVKELN